ncbi:MAG: hypothetical protein N2485_03870 [bacterium]|nr:hypothetical protein [bacterium]
MCKIRVDKKEKIKRMYKDNLLIQYIAKSIFEDKKKRYQEELETHKEEMKKY